MQTVWTTPKNLLQYL